MKKTVVLLIIMMFVLSGCGGGNGGSGTVSPSPAATPVDEPSPSGEETATESPSPKPTETTVFNQPVYDESVLQYIGMTYGELKEIFGEITETYWDSGPMARLGNSELYFGFGSGPTALWYEREINASYDPSTGEYIVPESLRCLAISGTMNQLIKGLSKNLSVDELAEIMKIPQGNYEYLLSGYIAYLLSDEFNSHLSIYDSDNSKTIYPNSSFLIISEKIKEENAQQTERIKTEKKSAKIKCFSCGYIEKTMMTRIEAHYVSKGRCSECGVGALSIIETEWKEEELQ